jgi:hypothetical protein
MPGSLRFEWRLIENASHLHVLAASRKPKMTLRKRVRTLPRIAGGSPSAALSLKFEQLFYGTEIREVGMLTSAGARMGLAGLFLAVALGASATAGTLENGLAAYERGDYTTALGAWIPLAERGNRDAQYNLGVMYYAGKGVRRDYPESVRWYRMSAEGGNAFAQTRLAAMYQQGLGLPQDDEEAFAWYRKAAEQDHHFAQYNLGLMYERGHGVARDLVLAYKWFELAATGSEPGYLLNDALRGRDRLAGRMTTAQVKEAKRLAQEWKRKQ